MSDIQSNNMKKRITQKEIAKDLGVGYITVQRALQGIGYVSTELKKRIIAYADKVGYKPSRAAQTLGRKKIRHIALFSSDFPSYFWEEVRNGALTAGEQISSFNYNVTYHTVAYRDTPAYIDTLKNVCSSGVDAIGIAGQTEFHMNHIINWIEQVKIPYATFNVDVPDSNRISYVGPDYAEGGKLAAEFLVKVAGERANIGIINACRDVSSGRFDSIDNTERQRGFLSYIESYSSVGYGVLYLGAGMNHMEAVDTVKIFISSSPGGFDGLYYISSDHEVLFEAIDQVERTPPLPVITHDMHPSIETYLMNGKVTAVIDQNPFLQGYYVVLGLERYIEAARIPDERCMLVTHQLVLNTNKHLSRNQYFVQKFGVSG